VADIADEVVVDAVRIYRGGLVVGMPTGVNVVPWDAAADAVVRSSDKLRAEPRFRQTIAKGVTPSEAFRRVGVL
ncbi:MAG: hypothetical protein M5T61_19845, partial [Acidimicrobiia bacterium]|nr:hypothetical protein [Acidimicrobiia bacterium]